MAADETEWKLELGATHIDISTGRREFEWQMVRRTKPLPPNSSTKSEAKPQPAKTPVQT